MSVERALQQLIVNRLEAAGFVTTIVEGVVTVTGLAGAGESGAKVLDMEPHPVPSIVDAWALIEGVVLSRAPTLPSATN